MAATESEFDPNYLQSLRELFLLLIFFTLAVCWSISVSYWLGYRTVEEAEAQSEVVELSLVFGMPSWVFWGILVPWIVVDGLAVFFCFGFMKADRTLDESAQPNPQPKPAPPQHPSSTQQRGHRYE